MAFSLTRPPAPPQNQPEQFIPIVPIRDVVIFPYTEPVLTFGRAKSVAAVEAAYQGAKTLILVAQQDATLSEPQPQDLYQIGTLVEIQKLLTIEGVIHALVRGIGRVRVEYIQDQQPAFWVASITPLPDADTDGDEVIAMSKHLTGLFKKAVNLGKGVDLTVFMRLMSGVTAAELTDQIASVLDTSTSEKQHLLETVSVKERLEKIIGLLAHEIKVLELEQSIAAKTQKRINRSMREAVLRERKKTIDAELTAIGAGEADDPEISELKKKIKTAKMPKDVRAKAEKELKRLAGMSPHNPEAGYLRNYLDWLVDMPWSIRSDDEISLKKAVEVLEEDHYGLKKVKERIIEYLAVMNLRRRKSKTIPGAAIAADEIKNADQVVTEEDSASEKAEDQVHPTILCFVGPPGVGKTSLGKSIARSLNRKFIRVSLGGVRDEAEIRGHRRTYVGAMPGRIIQGIKNIGTKNPVFMLDEIDKLGADMRGDPSAALLEALDPEQNKEFSDHYLEVPFDLSQVMFIATANVLETIPPALRDRLEIIRFAGYTEDEKFHIANRYLWPKQLNINGIEDEHFKISHKALKEIIHHYTREAGVRSLERQFATISRKLARKIAEEQPVKRTVNAQDISKFLGPIKFTSQLAEKQDEVGMATGLAYTATGGEILFIEVAVIPGGKGNLTLTGQLGDVMQESAKAAFSYIRTRAEDWGIDPDFAQNIDVHVHVPEGAVPKDGPSAGAAMATALTSALTQIPTSRHVAMTGEITLRGRVTEIGGLKEKLIAAHRAGIKTVMIPKENKKDLEEMPERVLKDMKIVLVNHLDQVLPVALKDFKSEVRKRVRAMQDSEGEVDDDGQSPVDADVAQPLH